MGEPSDPEDGDGEDVRRVSDGIICARKGRTRNGESFYATIWRMSREPEWQP